MESAKKNYATFCRAQVLFFRQYILLFLLIFYVAYFSDDRFVHLNFLENLSLF